MVAVTSPRNSSSHRLASPLLILTLENRFPSSSRQTSGCTSSGELNVLPNQRDFSSLPFIRWPVTNSPPFHSPSMPSTVVGGRLAQKSSSSASSIDPVRSLNSVNFLSANASVIAISFQLPGTDLNPALRELQHGIVLLRRTDGHPDTVGAVRADHDACVGRPLHEAQGARSERPPDEIRLRRRQGEPGRVQ